MDTGGVAFWGVFFLLNGTRRAEYNIAIHKPQLFAGAGAGADPQRLYCHSRRK
jgi:hypothetical protein